MSSTVKIGVFVPNGAQLLDIATVDVLATISREYLSSIPNLPTSLTASAPSVSIMYIATPAMMREASVPLTADMALRPTHSYQDDTVAPGTLDLVVVPGPDPQSTFDPDALKWLKAHFETPGVDVLSVCTGIYLCASAGMADGRQVSGPRGLQDDLVKKFPKMKLVGDNHRWVRDGHFWSSGGITNGNDLMAAYARQSPLWSNKGLVEMALKLTDVGDRGQFYDTGKSMFFLGFAWQMVRAWFGRSVPDKSKTQ